LIEELSSVSDDSFEEEVLNAGNLVLVDFWADWCAPCYVVLPSLINLAEKYKEEMKVLKMNVDENKKTSSKYGISSIPSLLIFKGGELKETLVGALPQDSIEEAIVKHL
jgi:thioredoxin 1